jgi:hypothetical protein
MSGASSPPDAALPRADPARPNLHHNLSLALHAAVADRLDDAMIARARSLLETWLARGGSSAPLLLRWREILALPLNDVRSFLADPGEEAAWLRKASPFAGLLPPREREQIVRRVRQSAGKPG